LLLLVVLFDFGPTILKPVLRTTVSFVLALKLSTTDVDFVKRNPKHVSEAFLGVGTRLRLLLEVSLKDIVLLLRETGLDFCADLKNGLWMRRRRRWRGRLARWVGSRAGQTARRVVQRLGRPPLRE
jgi:hypothetical protein